MAEQTEKQTETERMAELIKKHCGAVAKMLLDKNIKYGNSALNPIRLFSKADAVEQIKVRIDDKLSRVSRGNQEIEDEDVVNDLIGYLILLKMAKEVQT